MASNDHVEPQQSLKYAFRMVPSLKLTFKSVFSSRDAVAMSSVACEYGGTVELFEVELTFSLVLCFLFFFALFVLALHFLPVQQNLHIILKRPLKK